MQWRLVHFLIENYLHIILTLILKIDHRRCKRNMLQSLAPISSAASTPSRSRGSLNRTSAPASVPTSPKAIPSSSAMVTIIFTLELGWGHSSVDSSEPSILPPRVQIPSTPALLSIYIWIVSCGKDKNKPKRDRDRPIKNIYVRTLFPRERCRDGVCTYLLVEL